MTKTRFDLLCLAAVVSMTAGGCTSMKETFAEDRPEYVWRALVAVAETPDYTDDDPDDRWFVRENEVWVDEANARIEVYRVVDRVLQQPRTQPIRQKRTWRFQIWFDPETPATAKFVSRGFAIPTHAAMEADRYFDDVRLILEGAVPFEPAPLEPAPVPPPPRPPSRDLQPLDQTQPIIDIDTLEPQ